VKADDLRAYMVERRKRLGLTQAAIALRMGTDQAAVSRMESGATRDLTIDYLSRWSAALGLAASMQFREVVAVTFDLSDSPEGLE
jgi:transcriptional regulator with XRE-family HTH domain